MERMGLEADGFERQLEENFRRLSQATVAGPLPVGDVPLPENQNIVMKAKLSCLLLLGVLMASPAAFAKGASRGGADRGGNKGGKSFDRGCVVHVGVTRFECRDRNQCRNMDRDIDRSDGPSKGGVRGR